MSFVKRKGTASAKITPSEFESVKAAFLAEVSQKVSDGNIPDSFIFNWDQTALHLVPSSDWTMEMTGTKRVPIAGTKDKKEITTLITVSATGKAFTAPCSRQITGSRLHPFTFFSFNWHL